MKSLFRILALLLVSQAAILPAQPASTNRVLDLDGKGSYVELAPNIFNNLDGLGMNLAAKNSERSKKSNRSSLRSLRALRLINKSAWFHANSYDRSEMIRAAQTVSPG